MSTELFLGGVACLMLAAVIIVAMTTNKTGVPPPREKTRKGRK